VEGGVESLLAALRWLGLDWDEGLDKGGDFGPYVQSQRLEIYQEHATRLIETNWAYRCYCSPERLDEVRKAQQERKEPPRYDRHCRELTAELQAEAEVGGATPVVRFKTPLDGETRTADGLRGEVVFQNSTLDDFVIMKSDGYPTYHLAAMVDDHLMEITHVVRGEEWLPSAPRHFLIYQAFGWEPPVFAHVSRVLGSDKAKLSKRHGAHSVLEYRDQGYLPDALVNFLALLGWSLDDHTDIMSRQMLIDNFSVERLIPNPAVFNAEKLLWMNGVYIREMPNAELADAVLPFLERHLGHPADRGLLERIIPIVKERIKLLGDIVEMADFFFSDGPLEYDTETLLGKKYAGDNTGARDALGRVIAAAEDVSDWTHAALEGAIRPLAEELGVKAGDLFGVIRVAVTGRTAAPPLFETMEVLGREKTLERLKAAARALSG
jgi:glutamyl-tRNA synthetase